MKSIALVLLLALSGSGLCCASKKAHSANSVSANQISTSSPLPATSSSSGAIAAALIMFEQPTPPLDLDTLMTALQKRLPYVCTRTQWVGLTMVIPQIRMEATTPIILQINDDPEDVRAETKELAPEAAKLFGPAIAAKIARCRARLEVMTVESQPVVKNKSIEVDSTTHLDPSVTPVKEILQTVADTVHGYVFDTVHDKWQYAAP